MCCHKKKRWHCNCWPSEGEWPSVPHFIWTDTHVPTNVFRDVSFMAVRHIETCGATEEERNFLPATSVAFRSREVLVQMDKGQARNLSPWQCDLHVRGIKRNQMAINRLLKKNSVSNSKPTALLYLNAEITTANQGDLYLDLAKVRFNLSWQCFSTGCVQVLTLLTAPLWDSDRKLGHLKAHWLRALTASGVTLWPI